MKTDLLINNYYPMSKRARSPSPPGTGNKKSKSEIEREESTNHFSDMDETTNHFSDMDETTHHFSDMEETTRHFSDEDYSSKEEKNFFGKYLYAKDAHDFNKQVDLVLLPKFLASLHLDELRLVRSFVIRHAKEIKKRIPKSLDAWYKRKLAEKKDYDLPPGQDILTTNLAIIYSMDKKPISSSESSSEDSVYPNEESTVEYGPKSKSNPSVEESTVEYPKNVVIIVDEQKEKVKHNLSHLTDNLKAWEMVVFQNATSNDRNKDIDFFRGFQDLNIQEVHQQWEKELQHLDRAERDLSVILATATHPLEVVVFNPTSWHQERNEMIQVNNITNGAAKAFLSVSNVALQLLSALTWGTKTYGNEMIRSGKATNQIRIIMDGYSVLMKEISISNALTVNMEKQIEQLTYSQSNQFKFLGFLGNWMIGNASLLDGKNVKENWEIAMLQLQELQKTTTIPEYTHLINAILQFSQGHYASIGRIYQRIHRLESEKADLFAQNEVLKNRVESLTKISNNMNDIQKDGAAKLLLVNAQLAQLKSHMAQLNAVAPNLTPVALAPTSVPSLPAPLSDAAIRLQEQLTYLETISEFAQHRDANKTFQDAAKDYFEGLLLLHPQNKALQDLITQLNLTVSNGIQTHLADQALLSNLTEKMQTVSRRILELGIEDQFQNVDIKLAAGDKRKRELDDLRSQLAADSVGIISDDIEDIWELLKPRAEGSKKYVFKSKPHFNLNDPKLYDKDGNLDLAAYNALFGPSTFDKVEYFIQQLLLELEYLTSELAKSPLEAPSNGNRPPPFIPGEGIVKQVAQGLAAKITGAQIQSVLANQKGAIETMMDRVQHADGMMLGLRVQIQAQQQKINDLNDKLMDAQRIMSEQLAAHNITAATYAQATKEDIATMEKEYEDRYDVLFAKLHKEKEDLKDQLDQKIYNLEGVLENYEMNERVRALQSPPNLQPQLDKLKQELIEKTRTYELEKRRLTDQLIESNVALNQQRQIQAEEAAFELVDPALLPAPPVELFPRVNDVAIQHLRDQLIANQLAFQREKEQLENHFKNQLNQLQHKLQDTSNQENHQKQIILQLNQMIDELKEKKPISFEQDTKQFLDTLNKIQSIHAPSDEDAKLINDFKTTIFDMNIQLNESKRKEEEAQDEIFDKDVYAKTIGEENDNLSATLDRLRKEYKENNILLDNHHKAELFHLQSVIDTLNQRVFVQDFFPELERERERLKEQRILLNDIKEDLEATNTEANFYKKEMDRYVNEIAIIQTNLASQEGQCKARIATLEYELLTCQKNVPSPMIQYVPYYIYPNSNTLPTLAPPIDPAIVFPPSYENYPTSIVSHVPMIAHPPRMETYYPPVSNSSPSMETIVPSSSNCQMKNGATGIQLKPKGRCMHPNSLKNIGIIR
jgi:hypothetical protein